MADNNWAPQAIAVKEKITVTIAGTLDGETFQLGLGGQVFAEHTDGDTVPATTATALAAAWNASKHPWAAAVTATADGADVVLEADGAGIPFGDFKTDDSGSWESGVRGYYEIELNTPGVAATLEQDETLANRGPNCANLDANWSLGSFLADDEDVTIADSGIDILWGLDYRSDAANKVLLNSLDIRKSMVGKIGLDYATFNGLTAAPEYRGTYFQIMVDDAEGDVTIGKHNGPGSVLGSRRIKLDLKGNACRVEMHGSNSQPSEAGKPVVRILCDGGELGATIIHVRGAPGGFGIAIDQPGETSEAGMLAINCPSTKDRIFTGSGFVLNSETAAFSQNGGYCFLRHVPSDSGADTLDVVQLDDGILETEGDFQIDELFQDGGLLIANHWNSDGGAIAIVSAEFRKGTCDTTKTARGRTWGTVNLTLQDHNLLLHGTSLTLNTVLITAPGGMGAV